MQMSESLIKLSIKDFAKKKICDGHLYFITKDGKRFYLMKPGVLIDPAFIKKHAPLNSTFDFQPVVNEEIKKQFDEYFKELRYLNYERDLRNKVTEIVKFFQHAHEHGHHFLNFALSAYEAFCKISPEAQLKMHETDMFLFRKALYSGAFSVIIAMTNDFYHPMMLKDFFNLGLALDIGLCDNGYSYYVAEACNVENRNPGEGRAWMEKQKASVQELKVFTDHPHKSYQYLKGQQVLNHQELAEVALYQHELADGAGFPRGVPKGLVSNWESVVILADAMVEILDHYEFEEDVLGFITSFQNQKMSDLPVGRVYMKLCQALRYFTDMKETGT